MGIEELNIAPLEKVTDNTATPTAECCYPNCELCSKYVCLDDAYYCTVPIVVNKQMWRIIGEKVYRMERCMAELKTTVFEHILGDREP